MDLTVLAEHQELMDLVEPRESMDLVELRESMDLVELRELMAHQEQVDQREQAERQVLQVFRG